MYDYDKLVKKAFVIKTGFNQKAVLLDENEYEILPEDVIVSTDDGIGCVAGVMGGNDTKIDENTKNIVIEAATFDGAALRNTARRMNLLTDASQHYIKGAIDTMSSLKVLDRCTDLLVQFADAETIYETVHTPLDETRKTVTIELSRVNGLLGTSLTVKEVSDIFDSLCFEYTLEDELFTVTVPTYRNDITMDADLVEEVARIYGYDNIYCPTAVVYHVGSGTSGSRYNSFKVRLAARNNVYLNYKNMRAWQLLLNSPCLLAGTFVKFLFFKKMGFGKDYVSGFLEGIRTLKNCKRVPSFKGRIQREIGIQLELIAGTAVYVYEFSRRQAAKLRAKA